MNRQLLAGLYDLENPVINRNIGNISAIADPGFRVGQILGNIISIVISLAGVVFFFMLVMGGYQYLTAGGDKDSVDKARRRLTTAFTGIVLVFSVFAFLKIVQVLFGINLIALRLPTL